jgi:hypothetical protein
VLEAEEDEEHGGAAGDGDGWPGRRPWQSWMPHGYGGGVKETSSIRLQGKSWLSMRSDW